MTLYFMLCILFEREDISKQIDKVSDNKTRPSPVYILLCCMTIRDYYQTQHFEAVGLAWANMLAVLSHPEFHKNINGDNSESSQLSFHVCSFKHFY
jgi:hypothetical protein